MKAAMIQTFLLNLGISSILCLGERLLERWAFPDLHRTAARMATTDPSRADDIATIIAEAIGLLAIVWLFNVTLYIIGFRTRRPLKPQVPTLVAVVIVALTFAGAYGQWATLPPTPVTAPANAQ
jgi:hypothetical protein